MTRNLTAVSIALAVLLALPAAGLAQSPAKPKVTILPVPHKGGPRLDAQLKLVEKALRAQVTIVPVKAFRKAGRKMKVKPKDLVTVSGAASVGRDLALSHVIFVEGSTEKIGEGRKKKAVSSAKVTVVALESGDTLFTQSYVLKGKRLTKDVVKQMADDITSHLAPPAPVETPAPVAEAETPPAPPAPPADAAAPEANTPDAAAAATPPADGTTAVADGAAPAADAAGAAPEGAPGTEAATTADLNANPGATPGEATASAEIPAEAVPTSEAPGATPAGTRSPRWRKGFAIRAGALGFKRNAEIADGSGTAPLTYSAGGGLPTPAAVVQGELYPLALKGDGRWYEGFGLDGELTFTQVATEVGTASGTQTTKSTVLGGRAGAAWRFVLWGSETAADLKLRVGYGAFWFPLDAKVSSFPGARFLGPYAGLTLDFPVVKSVAIVLGGTYTPMLTVASTAEQLGTSVKSGSSFLVEGGVRVVLQPIEIGLMARMERFDAAFAGASSVAGASYTDATLRDTYTGGMLTVGMQL